MHRSFVLLMKLLCIFEDPDSDLTFKSELIFKLPFYAEVSKPSNTFKAFPRLI